MKSVLLLITVLILSASLAAADTYTMTTYYPAPNGKYKNLNAEIMTTTDTAFISNLIVYNNMELSGSIGLTADNGTPIRPAMIIFDNMTATAPRFFSAGLVPSPNGHFRISHDPSLGSPDIDINGSTGYVGINNSNPVYPLDVTGATRLNGTTTISAGGANITGNTSITGDTNITGITDLTGNTNITGGTHQINGPITFGDAASPDTATFNDSLIFTQEARFTNTALAIFEADLEAQGRIIFPSNWDITTAGTSSLLFRNNNNASLQLNDNSLSIFNNGATPVSLRTASCGGVNCLGIDMTPTEKFHVAGNIQATGNIAADGNMSAQGMSAETFWYSSDRTLKKSIVPISGALAKVQDLTGVYFNFKKNPSIKKIGFIAQDVESVIPEVVSTDKTGLKSVEYGNLVALLVEAIKEQQVQIDALRKELDVLKQ